jgi:glutamate formiminotransferase
MGAPGAVAEAAFVLVAAATARIDLKQHDGVHPRGGAVDVLPFVPLRGLTLDDCAKVACEVAARVSGELGIRVRMYGHNERPLPQVRRKSAETAAGVTCVGARDILIAFNVNLESTDLSAAKDIARAVRESSGGLPSVRALGFELASRNCVQVSMNLIDYRVTGIEQAFLAVRDLATEVGIAVRESELIGLAPTAGWPRGTEASESVRNFTPEKLIEHWY